MPGHNQSQPKLWLTIILTLALALRLFFIWLQVEHQFFNVTLAAPDSARYLALADNLLTHGTYSYNGHDPTAADMPGYPLFLAGIRIIAGTDLWPIYLMQALLSSATVGLVYLLGLKLFSQRAGLAASFFTAIYPLGFLFVANALSEILYTFLVTLFLALLVRVERSAWWALAAGLAGGAAALTRPILAGFVLLAGLIYLIRPGRHNSGLWLLLGFILLLFPWVARNVAVFGQFIPLSSRGGFEFYLGNTADSSGGSGGHFIWGQDAKAPGPKPSHLSEATWSSQLMHKAWLDIKNDPKRFLERLPGKIYNMWRPTWGNASLRNWFSLGGIYLIILLLSLSCLARSDCRQRGAWLWGFLLYHLLVHALVFGIIRYRIPVEPALCVLAGAGVVRLWPDSAKNRAV